MPDPLALEIAKCRIHEKRRAQARLGVGQVARLESRLCASVGTVLTHSASRGSNLDRAGPGFVLRVAPKSVSRTPNTAMGPGSCA